MGLFLILKTKKKEWKKVGIYVNTESDKILIQLLYFFIIKNNDVKFD